MLKQGRCLYCTEETLVAPVENWDDPSKKRYYCQAHYYEMVNHQEKEKQKFIEYYSNEVTRSWLSPKNLELYNRLTQK